MLPATWVTRPAFSKILPSNVVVVVLPLVPEMASTSPCRSDQASSSSPTMGMPCSFAASTTGASMGTPGLMTRPSTSESRRTGSSASRNSHAVPRSASSSPPKASSGLRSESTGVAPFSKSSCAAATPLRAMPTTKMRLLANFIGKPPPTEMENHGSTLSENSATRLSMPTTTAYMATICTSVMPESSK